MLATTIYGVRCLPLLLKGGANRRTRCPSGARVKSGGALAASGCRLCGSAGVRAAGVSQPQAICGSGVSRLPLLVC